MYFMKQMCKKSFDVPETRKVFSVLELLAAFIKLTSAKHPYYSQCNTTKGAFTRQSKNGTDPTKTGTVPIVFAKKQ